MTAAFGRTDAIIIGGGHNGLVCAFYLAKAGLKVTICERRGLVGGAAVTEEFHPGFRNSVAAYTVSLLNPRIIAQEGQAQALTEELRGKLRALAPDLADRVIPPVSPRAIPKPHLPPTPTGPGQYFQ